MRKSVLKWVYLPVITLALGLLTACKQTDESFMVVNNEPYSVNEEGARSLLISATPTTLSFASTVGTPVEQQTTIRIMGTGLSTLTTFQIYFVGEGAEFYSAEVPDPSIEDLLTGVPITVTYLPTEPGSTNVQMIVMASLLGLIDLNTTVDVRGMTFTVDPVLGTTIAPDIILQSNGDQGYFYTSLTFNENVSFDYRGFGSDNGRYSSNFDFTSTQQVGVIYTESVRSIQGGTESFQTTIPEGFIMDADGNPIQPIDLYYTLQYQN